MIARSFILKVFCALFLVLPVSLLFSKPTLAGVGWWHVGSYRGCSPNGYTVNNGDANYTNNGYTVFFKDNYTAGNNNSSYPNGYVTTGGEVLFQDGSGYCSNRINLEYVGTVSLTTGVYQFAANYDDAIKLAIDGNDVIKTSNYDSCNTSPPNVTDCSPGHTFGSFSDPPAITSSNITISSSGDHSFRINIPNGNGFGGGGAVGGWVGWKLISVPDTTPPSCDNISFNPTSADSNTTVTISDTVTDNVSVGRVDIYAYNSGWELLASYPNLSGTSVTKSASWTSSNWSHTQGTHTIAVNAWDSSDRFNQCTSSYTLTAPVVNGTLSVSSSPGSVNPTITIKNSSNTVVSPVGATGPGPVVVSVPPGTYMVFWGEVANYTSPSPSIVAVVVASGQPTSANRDYVPVTYTLATNVLPAGAGTVSKSPDLATYTNGTSVSLTANPGTGYNFDHWSGDLAGGTNPQSITMNGNKSVTANFVLKTYALTTNVLPTGSGTVSRSPNQATYDHGSNVSLTANPGTGYDFSSWTGDLTGSTNPQNLTMNGPKTVMATFVLKTYTVSTSPNPVAGGYFDITSKSGIVHGTSTSFQVTANTRWHITSVSGCWGTTLTNPVSPVTYTTGAIVGACTVTANFAVNDGSVSVTTQPSSIHPTFDVRNLSGVVVGSGTGPGPVSISLPSAIGGIQYTVTFNNSVSGYLVTSPNPPTVTVTVNPAPDAAAAATATYTPTVAVTINIYNDINGDGLLQSPPETYASGSLDVNCSSTSGFCLADNTTSSGIINLTLPINTDYSFTYNTASPNPAIYNRTSGGDINGATSACAGTVSMVCNIVNLTMSGATVNFLITGNPPPWIQTWDGDVHSNCDSAVGHCITNPSIRITVSTGSYFVHDSLGGSGGGLVSTLSGTGAGTPAACPSVPGPCSQRSWFVSNSGALVWPPVIDSYSDINGNCTNNVCYFTSSQTINSGNAYNFRGSGTYSGNVVIVNGNLVIDSSAIPGGGGTAISSILVVKGKVTISGSSTAIPLEIQGGILVRDNFDITYALTNNANPAVLVKYNPAILLNSTPLSQATYIWREVTAL